jgi:hypothetical protein
MDDIETAIESMARANSDGHRKDMVEFSANFGDVSKLLGIQRISRT